MREQVVNLEPHDDQHSARDKMGQAQVDRILLVWPRPARGQPRPLSRKLDLILVHRHASRLGAHLGLVAADDQIVDNAGELGLPVFDSVGDAHFFIWRSRRSLRPMFSKPPHAPPRPEDARAQLVPPTDSFRSSRWRMFRGGFFTALSLMAAATMLMLTLPSAEVALTPIDQRLTLQLEVAADPHITAVDYPNARIPALTQSTEASAEIEITTTGSTDLSTKSAQGTVVFTNLSTQQIRIPVGTAVRTSGGEPVRFVTQSDALLEPNRGMIATAFVQAVLAGPGGNVKTALINRVEGPLHQRVAVTNRQPIAGGETITLPSVTSADRSRAYQALLTQLRYQGYAAIVAGLAPHQFSSLASANVQTVTETNYSHFIGEHTDTLTLEMRATVTASVVNEHDAYQAGFHALERRVGPNMTLQGDTVSFSRSTSIAGDQSGEISFSVTARGTALPSIDPAMVMEAARWQPVAEARQILMDNFPLSKPPTIVVRPRWSSRTPWLAWRTNITFSAPPTVITNENFGG